MSMPPARECAGGIGFYGPPPPRTPHNSRPDIVPAQGHSPFILPMSARTWKFIIDGTRILAARSTYDALNSERQADREGA